jgi:uncharacterized protein with HEPN domain
MQPDSRKYLYDIREACGKLEKFTRSRSLDDYRADEMLRSAVERQFEIIGEALSKLGKLDSALVAQIRDSRRIIAFRNILIHGYATIRDETVWGVVQTDLPVLSKQVADLLRPGS